MPGAGRANGQMDDETSKSAKRPGWSTPNAARSSKQARSGRECLRGGLRESTRRAEPSSPEAPEESPMDLPPMAWTSSGELWELLYHREKFGGKKRSPGAFNQHPNLTPRMRTILMDWLMEVCEVYKMNKTTYFLAVDYVDRYLSNCACLPKNQLQLLGITCLFIAAKVEEIYAPRITEFAYVTDGACTEQGIQEKEMSVLQVLDWDVCATTASCWLKLFMQMALASAEASADAAPRPVQPDLFAFPQFSQASYVRASRLLDICSLDVGMLQHRYSVIAAAAILFTFNRQTALRVSGLPWAELETCVNWMKPFYDVVVSQDGAFLPLNPQNRPRQGTGLRRLLPGLLVDDAYSLQIHCINLDMFDMAQQVRSEEQVDEAQSESE